MAMSFLMTAGLVITVIMDRDFMLQASESSFQQIELLLYRLLDSDPVLLVMLFSNAAMIFIVMLFCIVLQKRTASSIGFVRKNAGRSYLAGAGAGLLLFGAVTLLNVLTGSLTIDGISPDFSLLLFLLFAIGFGIQGMAEEVLCRGYFLVSFGRRHSMWAAALANALLFAMLHLGNDGVSPLALINLTLFGIFASVYFIKSGNIWGIGAFHSIWNLAQGNFYGIRVSGIVTTCSVLASSPVEGRSLINGGSFGLEGGLAVTVVLLAGTAFLLWKHPAREPRREMEL